MLAPSEVWASLLYENGCLAIPRCDNRVVSHLSFCPLSQKGTIMEIKRIINGYLECDGTIVHVTSMDDIKSFVAQYGKTLSDISESELDKLTKHIASMEDDKLTKDDCGVEYSSNPLVLHNASTVVNYKIKEGTIAIANGAFAYPHDRGWRKNEFTKSISMPDTVIAIGDNAFRYCGCLDILELSERLLKIGDSAFFDCRIKTIKLPETLKYLGAETFTRCPLSEVVIPASVIKIGSHLFRGCQELTTVTFKGVPKSIGSGIFDGCVKLQSVQVPKGGKAHFEKELFPIKSDNIVEY